MSSFFFSVIAGEQLCRIAFAEGVFAAALFAIAAVGTFLSICWLFAAHHLGSEQLRLAQAIMVVVAGAAWAHTTLTLLFVVLAVEQLRRGDPSTGVQWWGVALAAIPAFVGSVVSWLRPVRRWLERRQGGLFQVTSVLSLAAAIVFLVGFTSSSMANPGPEAFPIEHRFTVMGTLSLIFSLYLANMVLIRRMPPTTATGNPELQPMPPKANSVSDSNDRRRQMRITIEFRVRRRAIK